jgi:uncharacterized repeat protein (TIGR01451 family)
LMSHTGGGHSVSNLTLTFDDAAGTTLANNDAIGSGTDRPSSYPGAVTFLAPAPRGSYGAVLGALAGQDPNGTWSLYVLDDATGDSGFIANGWRLDLATAVTLRPLADLAIGLSTTPASLFVGGALTNTIWVTNFGPASATGIVVTNTLSSGRQVTTNIGGLAPGATTRLTLVVTTSAGGQVVNTASVGGNEADLFPANNSAQTTAMVVVPAPAVLSGSIVSHQFHLVVTAQPNFVYAIQVSTNLTSWVSVSTNTASTGGTIKYTDTSSPNFVRRFYRTLQLTH